VTRSDPDAGSEVGVATYGYGVGSQHLKISSNTHHHVCSHIDSSLSLTIGQIMGSDEIRDNGSPDPDKKALSPPTEIQTAMMQELTPLSIQATSASTAKEVTITQVAPLVLVLTGATFLSASPSPLSSTPSHTDNRANRPSQHNP
jgi:hypothetical protein